MKNNIADEAILRNCTGCSICAPVCSTKAIRIEYDSDGFYKPIVDESKCVECGLCKQSCYKYDKDFKLSDDVLACYAAYNKDAQQLSKSSSGGISRLLMEECIVRGYKVLGCTYDLDLNKARSVIASTVGELNKFYGSKYFQSYTLDGFEEILKDRSEQRYAIFGTPCQIYAFSKTRKYKRNPEKYLLVDIFCHGCPTVNLWNKYKAQKEILLKSTRFDNIAFRSKTYGWHEYSIDFYANSRKHTSNKIADPFFDLFFGADVMNQACYDCKARSTMAYADIRIGDFWGPKYEMNNKGVSAVLVKSDLGQDFINAIREKMIMEDADFRTIIAAQSYGKTIRFNERRRAFLLKELKGNKELKIIYSQYRLMLPFKRRVKMRLKEFIKLLPPVLYFPIRKLMHSI